MNEDTDQTSIRNERTKSIRRFRMPLRITGILIALALLVSFGILILSSPCDRTKAAYQKFVIGEDDTSEAVAERLDDAGIVRDAGTFGFLTKITLSESFRPGTYYLSPSMNSLSIINTFTNGLTTSSGFTIPAGYTVEQIATALDRDGLADKDKFLKAAASQDLLQMDIVSEGSEGLKGADLVEGFLFPDEYVLSDDADESMMIIMMIDSFNNFYNEDYRARADEMGISPREVLIIASMIEKATSVDKERAAISSVIHNRYNLELAKDDEIPEKPLCSPSRESIIAALYPEESEYTHYVLSSKLDGTHVFTDDDEEYEQLLEEYKTAVEEREKAEAEQDAASDKAEAAAGEGGED